MEHKDIPDAQLHQIKGAVSASSGQVPIATGSGTAVFGFLDWAQAHGAVARDGLGMLVEQAAEAFAIWRGRRPPSALVLEELRRAPH